MLPSPLFLHELTAKIKLLQQTVTKLVPRRTFSVRVSRKISVELVSLLKGFSVVSNIFHALKFELELTVTKSQLRLQAAKLPMEAVVYAPMYADTGSDGHFYFKAFEARSYRRFMSSA